MNAVRPISSVGAVVVIEPEASLPPGLDTLAQGDVIVVAAPGARLAPGGAALAAVERAVRAGARDLVVVVRRRPAPPAWAAGLVPGAADHAREQLRRALSSRTVAAAAARGLRLQAWVHDEEAGTVQVLDDVPARADALAG